MADDLTLEASEKIIAAAKKKAAQLNTRMDIAVVDAGGNLKAFARMDGAWLGSIDISIRKARTARWFDMNTGEIGKLSQPGGPLYGIEHSNDGLITFPGGVPLKNSKGEIVGAIGVSGSTVESTVLPLTPIAPTISPLEFFRGTPPGKVINPSLLCSIPYKGPPGCESFPISPVFMSNQRAVRALRIEMSMLPSHAPSMRANAFRLPPASTTAISMRVLSCAAFFFAAAMIFSDASKVRSSAIRHLAWESGQTFFLSWWRKSRDLCSAWVFSRCVGGASRSVGSAWSRLGG